MLSNKTEFLSDMFQVYIVCLNSAWSVDQSTKESIKECSESEELAVGSVAFGLREAIPRWLCTRGQVRGVPLCTMCVLELHVSLQILLLVLGTT